jgi:hypothetical protein
MPKTNRVAGGYNSLIHSCACYYQQKDYVQETEKMNSDGTKNYNAEYGPVPKLSLHQKLKLKLNGYVFIGRYQAVGHSAAKDVYVVHCPRHGLFLDNPHGFESTFSCDRCIDEMLQVALTDRRMTSPC